MLVVCLCVGDELAEGKENCVGWCMGGAEMLNSITD